MPKLHEVKLLPYSIKQLFDLVMDVESYPQFLPFCIGGKVLNRHTDSLAHNDNSVSNSITAELTIKASLFKESYTSQITSKYNEEEATIKVEAITGPFKHIINSWSFKKTEAGSVVDFTLDFELKSLLLNKMVGGYLSDAYTKMINAFEKRAKEIYDKEK